MCTFKSDREVMVCDVAIGNVRALLDDLDDSVRYTVVHGRGTLVEVASDLQGYRFEQLVKAGIAAANSDAEL